MNFSFSEILVVLLIALLVVKPEQLPDLAHSLGRFVKVIRGVIAKVKEEMNELIDPADKPASDQHEPKK